MISSEGYYIYRIKNNQTGQFSDGNTMVQFTQHGKSWTSLAMLEKHIELVYRSHGKGYGDGSKFSIIKEFVSKCDEPDIPVARVIERAYAIDQITRTYNTFIRSLLTNLAANNDVEKFPHFVAFGSDATATSVSSKLKEFGVKTSCYRKKSSVFAFDTVENAMIAKMISPDVPFYANMSECEIVKHYLTFM